MGHDRIPKLENNPTTMLLRTNAERVSLRVPMISIPQYGMRFYLQFATGWTVDDNVTGYMGYMDERGYFEHVLTNPFFLDSVLFVYQPTFLGSQFYGREFRIRRRRGSLIVFGPLSISPVVDGFAIVSRKWFCKKFGGQLNNPSNHSVFGDFFVNTNRYFNYWILG